MTKKEGTADRREAVIRRWFDGWLRAEDCGIADIFAPDCLYVESWGPRYRGADQVAHWFQEWNTRGRVRVWEIKQFFHSESSTAVEWFFRCEMQDGTVQEFDGMSLVVWDEAGRIASLKEFGCNVRQYDPYARGGPPQFRQEPALWF